MMPSEVMYQVLGVLTSPISLTRRLAWRRTRAARKRPKLLPPSLPWLPWGKMIRSMRPKKSSRSMYFLATLMSSSCSVKKRRMRATRTLSEVARGSLSPSGMRRW